YSDRGSTFWLVDRTNAQHELLGRSAIARQADALVPVEAVAFPSRDGLTLHGYLARPRGWEDRGAPMVLLVHGGPWARDYWSYSHKSRREPARAEDRPGNEAQAPLVRARRAQGPPLNVHGADHPNLKKEESDPDGQGLRRAGKEVEKVVFPHGGHRAFDWRNN